jgi:CRISPR-associated endoribonuclease Cas2 subtype I-E
MSMTVVVTRNVSDRIRGFLSSSMLELAPKHYLEISSSVKCDLSSTFIFRASQGRAHQAQLTEPAVPPDI